MSITHYAAHGIQRVGIVGAGQMGLGIAYICATRAKTQVHLCDSSTAQLTKGVSFFDSLLAKDVAKARLTPEDAQTARERLHTMGGIPELEEVEPQLVIEVGTLLLLLLLLPFTCG